MKLLALAILAAGCAVAQESNEVDLLMLGASHHFQNRDYGYREFNPGVGLAYWRNNFGVAAATYRNSYDYNSVMIMPCYRFTYGSDIRCGAILGVGTVTGYGLPMMRPHASIFAGYERVNLHAAFIPYRGGLLLSAPTSATLELWCSVTIARF